MGKKSRRPTKSRDQKYAAIRAAQDQVDHRTNHDPGRTIPSRPAERPDLRHQQQQELRRAQQQIDQQHQELLQRRQLLQRRLQQFEQEEQQEQKQQLPATWNIDNVAQAVYTGDYQRLCKFITAGANVNETPSGGSPVLLCACDQGRYDCVRLLIDNGADVNKARTDNGTTPLFSASQHGHDDCVRLMI